MILSLRLSHFSLALLKSWEEPGGRIGLRLFKVLLHVKSDTHPSVGGQDTEHSISFVLISVWYIIPVSHSHITLQVKDVDDSLS